MVCKLQSRAHVKGDQRGGWDGGRGQGQITKRQVCQVKESPMGSEELSEVFKQAEVPNEWNIKPKTPKRVLVFSCQFVSLNGHLCLKSTLAADMST